MLLRKKNDFYAENVQVFLTPWNPVLKISVKSYKHNK